MFGAPKSTFGAPASSAFGQTTNTLFGSTTKPTNLFGQPSVGLGSGTTSIFGGGTTQQSTIAWGTGATTAATASNGTAIAFNPPVTPDTIQRGGQQTQVNAKHMCITAMKEYQDKSLEELRLEDYVLNRRSGTASATAGTSLFGGTSAAVKPFQFGTSQPTTTAASIFGQTNKPTNTLFGGSGLGFGASGTTTQPVFGQPAQTQGSLLGVKPQFGATQQSTNLFGTASTAQPSGFAFGQGAQTSSPFGAKPLFGGTTSGVAGGTGLFGTAQQASTGTTGFTFGQPQATGLGGTTNLFGQPAASTAAAGGQLNLFGAQPASTSVLPFGSTQTTNLFGAPKTTGSAPLFGTASTALGTTQQTGFGAFGGLKPGGTTGLFGATTSTTASKPGGIFGLGAGTSTSTGFGFGTGAATGQTPAFGAFGTGTSATGLFGQTAANTLTAKKPFEFGSSLTTPAVSSTPGLFGFGQTTSQAGGLFGGASLGATGLGGLGSTAGGTGTLFGQSTGFGGLQKPAAPGFGTGFALGGTTGLGTGLGTGGLFGATSSTLGSVPSLGQPLGAGLGGIGTLQPGSVTGALTGLSNTTAEQLAQNIRAQQQVLDLVRSMPYGQSSLFRYLNMPATSDSDEAAKQRAGTEALSSSTPGSSANVVVPARAAASALAQQHKAAGLTMGTGSPSSLGASIGRGTRLRQSGVSQHILKVANRSKLFSGFHEDDAFLSPSGQNVSPALRLRRSSTLSDGSALLGSPEPSARGSFFVRRDDWKRLHLPESVRASILERSAVSSQEFSELAENSLSEDHTSDVARKEASDSVERRVGGPRAAGDSTTGSNVSRAASIAHTTVSHTPAVVTERSEAPSSGLAKLAMPVHRGLGMARARAAMQSATSEDSVVLDDLETTWTSPTDMTSSEQWNTTLKSPVQSPKQTTEPRTPSSPVKPSKVGIKLTKPGYYTLPTLEELEGFVDSEGHCVVEDFVIGRRHYGHILFPGNTELNDLDLDNIVHIRRREVVVYPDDEKKPPVGFGLNRRAEICLESIWPTDKATREPIKSPERLSLMRFEERLERATRRMDARFIEYRPESGSWVFEVKHFSKYRLDDSDDEDMEVTAPIQSKTELPPMEPKLQQSKDASAKPPMLPLQTPKTPQLKAVGALITEADSNMHFSPDEFGSLAFQDSAGFGSKTMELTNLTPDNTSVQEADLNAVPASMKQMRDVFFSPMSVSKPSRASSLFSRPAMGEIADEADEFEAAAFEAEYPKALPVTGTKRFQASQVSGVSLTQAGDTLWSGGLDDDSRFGPAPGKLSRTAMTPSSKLERISDDSDNSSASEQPVTPRASFRPIPYEQFSQGVPLSEKHAPPITSGLHLARIPTQLKSVGIVFSCPGVQLEPRIYSYANLSKFVSNQALTRSMKTPDQLQRAATNLLSSMLIDASLYRGHGVRPSWGQIRFKELHTMVLLTPPKMSSPEFTHSAFTVSVNHWPSSIEQADENLLNTAMSTSECMNTGNAAGHTADPALQPPVDHCPQWQPISGLKPLEAYARALQCAFPQLFESTDEVNKPRTLILRRLISLSMALWGRHPQEVTANALIGTKFQKPDKEDTGEMSDYEFTPEQLESATENDAEHSLSGDDSVQEDHTQSTAGIRMLARKQALSEWIRAQSFPWLKALLTSLGLFDIVTNPSTGAPNFRMKQIPTDHLAQGVFACLIAGEPGAGCRLALAAGMPGLASLIAQSSSGDPVVRRGLQHQLSAWHQNENDRYIPVEILRIYALLAGEPRIPHPKAEGTFIDVLENLDWIRMFGAHLWYFTDYTADLSEVLRAYSSFWHSIDVLTSLARPIPPRAVDLLNPPKTPSIPSDFPAVQTKGDTNSFRNWPRDSAYHLIQLYCRMTHSLERTLDPCSISRLEPPATDPPTCRASPNSLLDWGASWHLWRALHALGYRHFSSPRSALARICVEFASQLEDAGLWEWAIFVLLHLSDQSMRDACVKAVVARHASLVIPTDSNAGEMEERTTTGKERFFEHISCLLDSFTLASPPKFTRAEQFVLKLGIPGRWIHEAKAILARQRFNECKREFNPDQLVLIGRHVSEHARMRLRARLFALLEAAHWFAAGYHGEAQKVCVEYLLPDSVLHTNLSLASGCVGAPLGLGSFSSVTRLGYRLNRLLSPYRSLPAGRLPERFEEGVGVYLRYSNILCLADELAQLCQRRSNTPDSDPSNQLDEDELQTRLSLILNSLNEELTAFMEQLQTMDTPNLSARVVKTEMAVTCAQMISAFLASCNPQSDMLVRLRRHLMSVVKINLPADYRLQELSTLSEAELSLGVI